MDKLGLLPSFPPRFHPTAVTHRVLVIDAAPCDLMQNPITHDAVAGQWTIREVCKRCAVTHNRHGNLVASANSKGFNDKRRPIGGVFFKR